MVNRIIDPTPYLQTCSEPWVLYNTYLNLTEERDNAETFRPALRKNPYILDLVDESGLWPGKPLLRHNDATHPIHKIALLADFGLKLDDPGIEYISKAIMGNQSEEGAFMSSIDVPVRYGGSGTASLEWMACDAPTLLYSLLKFGVRKDSRVDAAINHLLGLVEVNGWRCRTSIPKMRGPGRKTDHCPYGNLLALKALSQVPELLSHEAIRNGVDAQLDHWENRESRKIYLFGIGTTFKRLKYPLIWYDILHVADVLSQIPCARNDPRLGEMMDVINGKQAENSAFTPESVWRAYKGWSFGQKKSPCPWITYKVALLNRRMGVLFLDET